MKVVGEGAGEAFTAVQEFCTPVNRATFYTKDYEVKLKLLDLFDFRKKLHFCIFDHFLRMYYCLVLKFANFVQKLALLNGVQNSHITASPLVSPLKESTSKYSAFWGTGRCLKNYNS